MSVAVEARARPWTGPASTMQRAAWRYLPVAIFLLVWQLVVELDLVDRAFLPSVGATVTALWEMTRNGEIALNLLVSIYRALGGLAIGSVIGVAVGLAMATSRRADELFGPLVTVEAVGDAEEALARIDALPFALTGGVHSRDPVTIRRFADATPVGNLYVNRGMTGAMVGRQPFGGNRLSGTGSKAGGPDYLLGFVEPRVVSERTVRHGLIV